MAEEIVISADGLGRFSWNELLRCRHIFYALAKRDLLIRYRQAVFGAGWALARPIFLALSLSVALHGTGLAAAASGSRFLTLFLSLILWQLFFTSVNDGTNSLVAQRYLITRIYLPRIYVPAAPILVNLVDLLVGAAAFAVLFAAAGMTPSARLLLVFPLLLLLVLLTLSTAWLFAALNVRYRDFRQLTPYFLQVLFFLSPIAYSLPVPSAGLNVLFLFNPLTGIFEGMKYAVLGVWHPLVPAGMAAAAIETALCALVSVSLFRRLEGHFCDVI